jgi:hypothetical protein
MNQPHRQPPERHTVFDDTQCVFTGTLFVLLALLMFNQAGLLTGGAAQCTDVHCAAWRVYKFLQTCMDG